MKIAIMGGWNIASGASLHSELLGRELVKNNDVTALTFYKDSFHGMGITGEDEEYVVRCFTKGYGEENPKLDETPFLEEYDVFIVEDLGMLPLTLLANIFPTIKKKAKMINVIHDGEPSKKPEFYAFDWDAIVCFDERYKKFLTAHYPEEKLHIIPYPSSPLRPGNMEEARKHLNLPLKKKIIFLFGRLHEDMANEFITINNLASKYDILLLIVSNGKCSTEKIEQDWGEKYEIDIREENLSMDKIYQYLHASDALIYPKLSVPRVVVSSTIYQCLGSLCPIIAYDSNFVEEFSGKIFKYKNNKELESALTEAFEKGKKYKNLLAAAEAYVSRHSSAEIARKFEKLFLELKRT